MHVIALLSATAARHVGESGYLVGAVGALLMVLDGLLGARQSEDGVRRPSISTLGALLIAVGFVLGVVDLHWGP